MDSQPTIAEQQVSARADKTAVRPAASGMGSASVHLGGRALVVARTIWIVAAITSWLIFVLAVPARYAQLTNPSPGLRLAIEQAGISVDFYALYILSLEITLGIASGVVGLIIFLRRPAEVIALFVSFLNVIFGIACFPISQTIYALTLSQPAYAFPFRLLNCLAWVGAITSLYLFPDGRFVPRWTRFTISTVHGSDRRRVGFLPRLPVECL